MNMPYDEQATAILRRDDPSVPETRYQTSWDVNATCALKDYPAHTRVVAIGAHLGTCSLAYAVSQAGARRLMNDLGLHRLDSAFDLMLRDWCEGTMATKDITASVCSRSCSTTTGLLGRT